ncbi:MAG TPA: MurR/RpiR family transcriptional regulator [Verrucomicrobiae bacterium]|nr:MurR/RpiR family transcriptional regulator [Verrucomicrobiae bacterium]
MNPETSSVSTNPSDRVPHRCLIRLRGIYRSLKTAERKAADFLLASPDAIHEAGVVEFAARAGCSEATVVRLAQRLGYDGYPGLRNDFGSPEAEVPYRDIATTDRPETVLSKVFANSVQALQDTLASIDPTQYRKAVDALAAAKSLAFFGLGNAAVVAREAYHKFLRIGVPCHTAEDPDLQLIILSNHLNRGDLMVAISYSGESKPILSAMRAAQARGIRVLAITNFPRSSLARAADLVLLTAVFQEHINGEIGSQRLAQLAVLESLYVNYLLRSGPSVRKALASANEVIGTNKNRQFDPLSA